MGEHAAFGMLPSSKSFRPADPSAGGADLRLEPRHDFTGLERGCQLARQIAARLDVARDAGVQTATA